MKNKILYVAVVVIAALSSCSNNNDILDGSNAILDENNTQALVFTATIETDGATRTAIVEGSTAGKFTKVSWLVTDKINVNGAIYAVTPGTDASTATLTKESGATRSGNATATIVETFKAYYPASLYNNGTASLPATYTYDGNFNMPMYAESTETTLSFKNLCGVLAISVPREQMSSVKSIIVSSDKQMNGAFTATSDGAFTFIPKTLEDTDKKVELIFSTAKSITDRETFYVPVPDGTYGNIQIVVSNGTTTKIMKTKDSSITVNRNNIYPVAFSGENIENSTEKSRYITVDGKQIEVVTYQKKGSDKDNIVWVFTGEGYTQSDINRLESDLDYNIKRYFYTKPFDQFKDRINIYIAKVVSDNNFGGTTPFGIYVQNGRQAVSTTAGEEYRKKIQDVIETNILDTKDEYLATKNQSVPKTGINNFQILVNSSGYFGSGTLYGQKSIFSLGGYSYMNVHEMSHCLGLVDEYPSWGANEINCSAYNAIDYVPWKDFLGYRGIGLFNKYGYPRYKPAVECIMYDGNTYCAVCEAYVFRQLNEMLGKDLLPLYYGELETTTVEESDVVKKPDCYMDVHAQKSYTPETITSNNLTTVNGKEIEARTVAINFLSEPQEVTINLVIKKGDGTVKHKYSKTYTLDAYKKDGYYSDVQKKSLTVKTGVLKGLESTDTIETFITTK